MALSFLTVILPISGMSLLNDPRAHLRDLTFYRADHGEKR
jgi:hypothetical protein